MIVRKFKVAEWEEVGEIGWQPQWMKGADIDPATGFGVAHDVLEHICDKIGGATGEYYAFGAIIFNRLEGGWLRMQPYYRQTDEQFLTGIVVEILNNMEDPNLSNQRVADPGRWKKLEDYDHWNEVIPAAVDKAIAYQREEVAARLNEEEDLEELWAAVYEMEPAELSRRIQGWITKGFRAAVRYYGKFRLDACEVAYLFQKIIDELKTVDMYLSEEYVGAEMSMHIDLRGCSVECRMIEMNNDY